MKLRPLTSRIMLAGLLLSPLLLRAAAPLPPVAPPPVPDRLDLETALKYALEHSYSILQARERIREQEGLIIEVKAQALPNATVNGAYSRLADEIAFGKPPAYQNWNIALNVRQTLYAGGAISAALDAQRFVRESALLDLRATINNALLDTRTKFYAVLFTREQIQVQTDNIRLLEQQLTDVSSRYAAGTVSNFEVLTAKVQLANAQPALITANNDYRLAIDQLRQSLGYSNSTPENLKKIPAFDGTLDVVPASYELQAALDAARAHRPELPRLAVLEQAGEAGVRIAQSGYRPTLALVGGYEFLKSPSSNSFGDSPDGWTVGLQGSWAIFDGRATDGKVAQAKSQLAQTRLSREEQILAVEVAVRSALSSLQEAKELVDAATQVAGQAVEAQRLAKARFDAGTATQLDELTSDVALTQARNNQLSANFRYNVALATLRTALGEADAYVPGN